MSAMTSATMDLLKVGLVSDKISPMELRTFADWTVKPRLLSVPGVARCVVLPVVRCGSFKSGEVQPERLMASRAFAVGSSYHRARLNWCHGCGLRGNGRTSES